MASPAVASATTASTAARPPSTGRPARASSACSPTSVSQQPTEPHRHVAPDTGFTGMWPTSPPKPAIPVSGRPPTMSPPPRPTSADRNTTSSQPAAAPRRCSARAPRSASLATTIGTAAPNVSARTAPSGTSRQPRFGAVDTKPSSPADDADDRHADPDERVRAPCRRDAARRARRGRPRCRRRVRCPRGRSTRTRSSTSPPSPTTATASESTAISRARTTARSGARCTSGDGSAGQPERLAPLLDDEAGVHEVADEPADAAAREAGALAELAARQRPVDVQRPHERAEVGATDALAALSPVPHCPRTPSRVCASRAQTLAASIPPAPRPCQPRPVTRAGGSRPPRGSIRSCGGSRQEPPRRRWRSARPPDVAAGRRRRPPPARRTSSPMPAGSTTATTATSRSSSVAAWPRSTATTTGAASSTSPAAARRPRCTTTTARSAGRSDFTALPSPVTDLTDVTGAYPLDVDSDGHTDLAVLRAGQDVILRGLGDCRFERADEALGIADDGHLDRRLQRHVGGGERAAHPRVRRLRRTGSRVVRGRPSRCDRPRPATGTRRRSR